MHWAHATVGVCIFLQPFAAFCSLLQRQLATCGRPLGTHEVFILLLCTHPLMLQVPPEVHSHSSNKVLSYQEKIAVLRNAFELTFSDMWIARAARHVEIELEVVYGKHETDGLHTHDGRLLGVVSVVPGTVVPEGLIHKTPEYLIHTKRPADLQVLC